VKSGKGGFYSQSGAVSIGATRKIPVIRYLTPLRRPKQAFFLSFSDDFLAAGPRFGEK
jgi:hypothetical protein